MTTAGGNTVRHWPRYNCIDKTPKTQLNEGKNRQVGFYQANKLLHSKEEIKNKKKINKTEKFS